VLSVWRCWVAYRHCIGCSGDENEMSSPGPEDIFDDLTSPNFTSLHLNDFSAAKSAA
jgi:hypothetical protein